MTATKRSPSTLILSVFAFLFLCVAALGPLFGLHQLRKQNQVLQGVRTSSHELTARQMATIVDQPQDLLNWHQELSRLDPHYLGFKILDAKGQASQEAIIGDLPQGSMETRAKATRQRALVLFFRPQLEPISRVVVIMATSYFAAALGVIILVFGWGRKLMGLQKTATARAQEFGLEMPSGDFGGGDLAAFNQVLEAAIGTLQKREVELLKVQDAQSSRLENLEQALDFIIEKTALPLLVLDENQAIRKASTASLNLLKLEEPPSGRLLGAWYPPLGKALKNHSIKESVVRGTTEGPLENLVLGFTALTLNRPGQETPSILILLEDLTAQQAREKADLARTQLAATGEMAAEVAHEIRNSLGTILAHLRLLEGAENQADHLTRLRQEVDRVSQITQTYLANARPLEPSWGQFSLRETLDLALDDLEAEGFGGQHNKEFKGHFPELNGDQGLWARAMDNIFRNAFQAMDERGPGKLTIHGYQEKGAFVLAIEDQGKGLATDRPSDIFKPFVTTKEHGTGLGLSMTRKIIEAHQGSIRAMESPGGGLILFISIPKGHWHENGNGQDQMGMS